MRTETNYVRCSMQAFVLGTLLIGLSSRALTAQEEPTTQPEAKPAEPETPDVDRRWLERLPKEDRAALDEIIGFAPPRMSDDLKWIGTESVSWDDLRGKVIVVQSWTTANLAGRRWPQRLEGILKDFEPRDLKTIALHTPEEAENVETILERNPPPQSVTVAIDPVGAVCDSLGIYKRPVNLVIDKHGEVRYAGLNARGLQEAVTALIAEPFDQSKRATPRPDEKTESPETAEFPATTGSVSGAIDLRGKRAFDFVVGDWINRQPNARGKVVILDFWTTEDPRCQGNIAHLAGFVEKFGNSVCCVGLSDEKAYEFEEGIKDFDTRADDVPYGLAVDPRERMKNTAQVSTIPYCFVMSSDWIVRWQGPTRQLTATVVEQIVNADRASQRTPSRTSGRRGWTK